VVCCPGGGCARLTLLVQWCWQFAGKGGGQSGLPAGPKQNHNMGENYVK